MTRSQGLVRGATVRLKTLPGDFVVTERATLRLSPQGPWGVYRVRKVACTTLAVQTRLAAQLNLPRQQVIFPALKDKEAVTVQFATLPASAPETVSGPGFEAQRIGYRQRPLAPSDLLGNDFEIVMRAIPGAKAQALRQALLALGEQGLPNYFDEQRFGSYAPDWGFIGKPILQRDAAQALYTYLARPWIADPPPIRAFKRRAAQLWPDWRAIMGVAPRPSNYRSVLTYLQDHPEGFRKALNLIPQRLLALYLAAYQSHLWNRIAATWLEEIYRQAGAPCGQVEIIGVEHPFHLQMGAAALASWRGQSLPLPTHRTTYQPAELGLLVERLLAEEGLTLADLKARILQKAYLPHGQRPLLLQPQDLEVSAPQPDDRFPGQQALRVRFGLPSGSYATLVCKVATARMGHIIQEDEQ